MIFPEGGRSPDGWGQPFRGGAAYLSVRCGVPVVPVHLEGTGPILRKGMKRPAAGPHHGHVRAAAAPAEGENTRRFGARIEAAVAALADEATTDCWTARRRAAAGTSPTLTGPELHRLAPPVGPHQAPPPGHRRLASAAARPAAGPTSAEPDSDSRSGYSVADLRRNIRTQTTRWSRRRRWPISRRRSVTVAVPLAQSAGAGRLIVATGVEVRPVGRGRVGRVELLEGDVELAGDDERRVAALDHVRRVRSGRRRLRGRCRPLTGVVGVRRRRRPWSWSSAVDELGARRDRAPCRPTPGNSAVRLRRPSRCSCAGRRAGCRTSWRSSTARRCRTCTT